VERIYSAQTGTAARQTCLGCKCRALVTVPRLLWPGSDPDFAADPGGGSLRGIQDEEYEHWNFYSRPIERPHVCFRVIGFDAIIIFRGGDRIWTLPM